MAFTDSADMQTGAPQVGELPDDDMMAAEAQMPPANLPAPVEQQTMPQQHQDLLRWSMSNNIAEEMDQEELNEIGNRVKLEFQIDFNSRADWVTKTEKAMDLAMQVAKEKQYPWPKASNVIFPLMTTAAIQFAARAYPAIVNGPEVVKGVIIGSDAGTPATDPSTGQIAMNPQTQQPVWKIPPGAKRQRATRVGEHMSWQLLEEMPEWEAETDQLLHILPICGCVFRKSYFDPGKGRNMSVMVSPFNVVINYHARSLEIAPRITEEMRLYPVEIEEAERSKQFLKIDYPLAPNADGDLDAPQEFLEQHRYLDLDDDDYPEPYIVTTHKLTNKVVRIRARYEPTGVHVNRQGEVAKIDPVHYYTKYDFLPNPDGGIYGLGFGQLLRPINEAINTTMNLIIDAGHLSVTGGGFIGKGLSMNTGAIRFVPGEYKMVNVPGSVVKDSIVPLDFPGPSNVLFQMLGLLMESGKEIASIKDVLTGEQQQHNIPATTTLALIEQGLKTFTAIYKRVHRSLKMELNKLYRLNGIYLADEASYRVGDDWKIITRADYMHGSGVEPVSDPTMVSDSQRLGKAQFLLQFGQDPMFNGMEIRRRVLDAAQIDDIDSLLVQNPPPNPAMMAKAMEIQIKAEREKAAELKDLANAILFFAQADAAVGDSHLAWVGQQLEAWKTQYEASQPQKGAGADGGPPPGPTAPPPVGNAPMPSAAHPHAGPIPTPPAPAGAPGQPPIPGARQAPDGHFYIPNPARAGKYLLVH